MKQVCFIFLIIIFFSSFNGHLYSQDNPFPQQKVDELKRNIEEIMRQKHIPGIALSIVTKDSVLFSGGIGFSNYEKQKYVSSQDLFQLGSLAKNFTALGILCLINEGKLKLNDELKKVAPEIAFENKWEVDNPIKIVTLLEHTTGFGDIVASNTFNLNNSDLEGKNAVNIYTKSLKSRWQPNQRMSYSNLNYMILGYLIEKISDKKWTEYVASHILAPLNMSQTNFDLRVRNPEKYAIGYDFINGQYKPCPTLIAQGNGADGALNSNADDMTKFLKFYLNDWKFNGNQILPTTLLNEMETIHSTLGAKGGLTTGYGLGNETYLHPKAVFRGHEGGIIGFQTSFQYNKELGIGFFFSCNGGYSSRDLRILLQNFLTQNIKGNKTSTEILNIQEIEPYLGFYSYESELGNGGMAFWDKLLEGVTISSTDSYLLMNYFLVGSDTLRAFHKLNFVRNSEGQPRYNFGVDLNGNRYLADGFGNFYIKKVRWPVILHQICVGLGLLAAIISLLFGIISIINFLLRKLNFMELPVRVLPAISVLSEIIGLKYLLKPNDNPLAFASINAITLTIFLGTLFFAILTLISIWLFLKNYRKMENKITRLILAFNLIFISYIVIWFLMNNFVGIRVWD